MNFVKVVKGGIWMKMDYIAEADKSRIYPPGVAPNGDGFDVCFISEAENCGFLLFKKGSRQPAARIPFPLEGRMGNVHFMTVKGNFEGLEYAFEEDGKEVPDLFGRQFGGCGRWGSRERTLHSLHTPLPQMNRSFDWEDDRCPAVPAQDCIIYKIHPRGFTKHGSSGLSPEKRGTFKGIIEKIPYLKELGITTLEMMPPVEFNEIIPAEKSDIFGLPQSVQKENREEMPSRTESVRLNYWGYCKGFSFAPKAAYASSGDSVTEFKQMVKALHREGLELVIELYFDGSEAPGYVLDVVRFWAMEYHVDGVHLVGFAPLSLLAEDPYLKDLKLWGEGWKEGDSRRICEYNSGFMMDMRRFLKGDEGMLNSLAYHLRHNPNQLGNINYMANVNGFTMMDMVSYNEKHNEDNGEDNRDGLDQNHSWNCGAEGPVRKKRVRSLRLRQLKNAMLLLFLSQGTPLLLAGDEFGQTKRGNNNSYCQDNEISWLNWDLTERNKELFAFVKQVIAFRKAHDLFHMDQEPRLMDYKDVGLPDLSYHGEKAWQPEFDRCSRQFGAFYCGDYAGDAEKASFYTAYNMHWEPHEFALPNLPKGRAWRMVFNTAEDSVNGFWPEGEEPVLKDQKKIMIGARAVCVFMEGPEALSEKTVREKEGKKDAQ